MVRKQLPFHQHHDGLVRIKSWTIRVYTMDWIWLAVKMAVIFHLIWNIIVFGNPLLNIKTNNLSEVTRIFQDKNSASQMFCWLDVVYLAHKN